MLQSKVKSVFRHGLIRWGRCTIKTAKIICFYVSQSGRNPILFFAIHSDCGRIARCCWKFEKEKMRLQLLWNPSRFICNGILGCNEMHKRITAMQWRVGFAILSQSTTINQDCSTIVWIAKCNEEFKTVVVGQTWYKQDLEIVNICAIHTICCLDWSAFYVKYVYNWRLKHRKVQNQSFSFQQCLINAKDGPANSA